MLKKCDDSRRVVKFFFVQVIVAMRLQTRAAQTTWSLRQLYSECYGTAMRKGCVLGSLVCAAIISLDGCSMTMRPEGPRSAGAERQYTKNYTIGEKKTVNVGDAMIKFQDYWVERIESPVVSPERTVNLEGGLVDITFNAGQKYAVVGRIAFDGVEYSVVPVKNSPDVPAALIKQDGTLLNRVARIMPNGEVVVVVYSMTVSDPTVRMVRDSEQHIATTKGYQNFELIYTGTTATSLNITYREFSPEGLARTAFYQNLTYEAGSKLITFKNFRVAVESASSESITFTVVSDGNLTGG